MTPGATACAGALLALALSACAGNKSAYQQQAAAAMAAYEQGDYEGAADHWSRAREVSESARDRDEATYRAAMSLRRAGREDDARTLLLSLATKDRGTRTSRAAFDLAFFEIKGGNEDEGQRMLRQALERFPDAGVARDALRRHRAYLVERHGAGEADRQLKELATRVSGTELESTACFERAKLLYESGRLEEALSEFQHVAKAFPYPNGVYWDDAMLSAARVEHELAREEAAERRLMTMLERRESAALTGSYERGYDKAYFLLAEVRLSRGQWRAARDAWLELANEVPGSRLSDDALWAAAVTSSAHGDTEGACNVASRLKERKPESRFVPCLFLVCENQSSPRECNDYIEREFRRGTFPEPGGSLSNDPDE